MDHGGCGLLVGVKDNSIVDIQGDPDGFLNRGYVCPKGLASYDRLIHPSRLTQPLKRSGKRGEGKWEKIEWEEAIAIISDHFLRIKKEHGAKAVAFCQGMPKGLDHFVLIRLANIFGSPNVVAVQDVCHAPREISGYHTCGFYPVTDYHHKSKLVMLWGSNITSTNEEGQICSQLLDQLKQGTQLVVIDPRKTEMARRADLWLQLKPGTDVALALAFLNVIVEEKLYEKTFVEKWTNGFDQLSKHVKQFPPEKMSTFTWIPADLIRKGARLYAQAKPAAMGWGNPIEQNRHSFDSCRSLVCLMAICGNLDIPGGNIQANDPDIMGLGKFVRADLIPDKRKHMIHAYHNTIPGLMTVPSSYLKKAILEDIPYPVKGAYFQCTNPLLGYADSKQTLDAMMKLDFFAVSDIFMTPSALLADIVLPAATHFEFNDIGHYGLGHGYILARPKVVDPPKGCRPDIEILNELGKSLTDKKYWHKDYHTFLDMVLEPAGLTFKEFAEKGYLKGLDQFNKYRPAGFRTSTGKVELVLSQAERLNVSPLPQFDHGFTDSPEYPLILTSCKSRYYLHSSYRWMKKLRKHRPCPKTMVNRETARKNGIKEGDDIIIETRCGRITQVAHLSDTIHPGVIQTAYGWWFPEEGIESGYDWKKSNYNMLTCTDDIGKEFGTPNLKGIACRISRKQAFKIKRGL
jgi:anaerobic selenocysteine-containing dehydrogenase